MSNSQMISEVFCTEHYMPFVRFCERNGMVKMSDLTRCPFDQLAKEKDIGPTLAIRIKSMVDLYRRNHPEEFMAQKSKVDNAALTEKLEEYFRKNPGRVLHIAEISKAVCARRNDILPILQEAPWCQMVDLTSFYYR